jgi:transposase InsO family protein
MFGESYGNEPLSLPSDQDVLINAIRLGTSSLNDVQLLDPNLKWIYDLKKEFKHARPNVGKIENKERTSLMSQWNRLIILGGNLYREFVDQSDNVIYQFVVPKDERLDVMRRCHDSVYSGHLGVEKTTERIVRKFYWYKQLTEIQNYVQSCILCQQTKIPQQYNVAPLQPLTPTRPSELVTTDIMGPLPKTKGGNFYVLVVIDHFTKWVELYALPEITSKTVANRLMLFFFRYGIPDTLLSDQGTNYQSEVMVELCELLDIHKVRTSPYHPECDGLTERFNRTLQAMIQCYVADHQGDWDEFLPSLAFAYNTAVHSTTKSSPFELVYGRLPKVPSDLIFKQINFDLFLNPENYAKVVQGNFLKAFSLVVRNRDLRMQRNKVLHDRRVRAANFEITDQVWLLDTAVTKGKTAKLSRRWKGPYKIMKKVNESTYNIRPVSGRGKHLVANQCRLQKCFTRDCVEVVVPPAPVVPSVVRKKKPRVVDTATDIVEVTEAEQWPNTCPQWPPHEVLSDINQDLGGDDEPAVVQNTNNGITADNSDILVGSPERLPVIVEVDEELVSGETTAESDVSYAPTAYYERQLGSETTLPLRTSSRLKRPIERLGLIEAGEVGEMETSHAKVNRGRSKNKK